MVTAIVGIATKFFTCTLSVMYRGTDSQGKLQGGPMYVIREGMSKRFRPLASMFALAGMVGCLPLFQTNQLIQTVREVIYAPEHILTEAQTLEFNLVAGIALSTFVATVIFGGLHRIALVASRVVPTMTLVYVGTVLFILAANHELVLPCLELIVDDAFTGLAAAGGVVGTVIATGVRRGAFSNEAGIGTESMAHGAARTAEPVREGLVAMIGPVIDTLIVCTATALLILVSGVWREGDANGVTMTADAFRATIGASGVYILITCIAFFSMTTIFTYSYYGTKCLGYLAGADKQHYYNYIIVLMTVVSSVLSLDAMIALVDGAFALMAIPTMVSTLVLSPRVMAAARVYFADLRRQSEDALF